MTGLHKGARDSLLWTGLLGIALWLVPIGAVSGDGLAQSVRYLAGNWHLNPNHLLLEPAGAWWLTHLLPVLGRSAPDVLKLLSITTGALSIGLFRFFLAPMLSPQRSRDQNWTTALFALNAGFIVHLLSDETHIIQMPCLVLLAAASLGYLRDPGWKAAFWMGLAGGAAALFYISNLILFFCVAGAISLYSIFARRKPMELLGLALGTSAGLAASFGLGLLVAWNIAAPDGTGPIQWITSYGGGGSSRVSEVYGIEFSIKGLAIACVRTLVGSASAVVDQTALFETLRGIADRHLAALLAAVALGLAMLFVMLGLWRSWRSHDAVLDSRALLAGAWISGVLLFALYWSNSDAQFYFQLAPAIAILAAVALEHISSKQLLLLVLPMIAWNVIDATRTQILYPRARYTREFTTAVSSVGLVIVPGQDLIDQALYFVPVGRERRLSITSLAEKSAASDGLARLDSTISATLSQGGTVLTIGIVGASHNANPWRFLASLGYEHAAVEATISRGRQIIPVERVGAFDAASIRGVR